MNSKVADFGFDRKKVLKKHFFRQKKPFSIVIAVDSGEMLYKIAPSQI
jgi:hypothetical protein